MRSTVYEHQRTADLLTGMTLDQMRELRAETREQSHMLGWIMGQLKSGREVHLELKAGHRELKAGLNQLSIDVAKMKADKLRADEPDRPGATKIMDSVSGLLTAGRPYLVAGLLCAGKAFGLGPSWIEPLLQKIIAAL